MNVARRGVDDLVGHLIEQRAFNAARRLCLSRGLPPPRAPQPARKRPVFAVDVVRVVADADSTKAFALAMQAVIESGGRAALDAEWDPASIGGAPSLVQVAIDDESAWLLDVEVLKGADRFVALDALRRLLSSNARKVGFGVQADLVKLAVLLEPLSEASELQFPNIIDLNVGSGGLAAAVKLWTAFELDKAMQCSAWHLRPLSKAQIEYAAADACCLLLLENALLANGVSLQARAIAIPRTAAAAQTAPTAASTGSLPQQQDASELPDAFESVRRRLYALRAAGRLAGPSEVGSAWCAVVTLEDISAAVFSAAAVGSDVSAAVGSRRVDVNALCVMVQDDAVLVLCPSEDRLDLKWLATVLKAPRRGVRLATRDECVDVFGCVAGRVPPCACSPRVKRVLAHPKLYAGGEHAGFDAAQLGDAAQGDTPQQGAIILVASSGAADSRLVLSPRGLEALAGGGDGGGEEGGHTLEVLPDPTLFFTTVDDALSAQADTAKLLLESSLQGVARKLRMVGVDAAVAGERVVAPSGRRWRGGLDRIRVDATLADGDYVAAALEGRLIVAPHNKRTIVGTGAFYRLSAARGKADAAHFSELLAILGLDDALTEWGSRCGICNGDSWQTLDGEDPSVAGEAPIGLKVDVFFRCGVCRQLFWPGAKYDDTMATLKGHALNNTMATLNNTDL
ncbi:hypothetical protein M885DRAFT_550313 [Pelagophyceae sp. CCMP2097]|nr:hypothetical protein M885DRAFT_550313 [Pelagophyceae sp. CCMP2097]